MGAQRLWSWASDRREPYNDDSDYSNAASVSCANANSRAWMLLATKKTTSGDVAVGGVDCWWPSVAAADAVVGCDGAESVQTFLVDRRWFVPLL